MRHLNKQSDMSIFSIFPEKILEKYFQPIRPNRLQVGRSFVRFSERCI
ncbi:hypothetical protein LEP1GSC058_2705 [Leptospira fainei serovar Hurstbridge str. BUT 6]|uniref:Uncharacterized protein n=1 Tax=Leptospira fainei serovar Hurstbridge str. BUT 6 TaxID=1193011 RepID=S3UVJ6_9LEPT|nr:hypothetical protein LEP1GSC058_2705 [Leptospira fainei serovar Hurstbridge str. BUT 6]